MWYIQHLLSEGVEEEWMNLPHIFKQVALVSLDHKRKWQRKKGISYWDDHMDKVISDK